jgi:uncharacterized protein YbaR (Trm112 family)
MSERPKEEWKVICPVTRQKLVRRTAAELPEGAGESGVYWVPEDGSRGYPEVGGIPVLLEKEAVVFGG